MQGMSTLIARQKYTVGERMRALRIARGLTMAGVADTAGVALGTIQQLENGASDPTNLKARTIAGLARAYRLEEREILDLLLSREP